MGVQGESEISTLPDGFQGRAASPLVMGVSGEHEGSLTGDATATRCMAHDGSMPECANMQRGYPTGGGV